MLLSTSPIFSAVVEEKNTTDVETNSKKPAVIEKKNTTDGVKNFENPAFEEEGEPYIEDDPFIENNPFDVLGRNSENPVVEGKNATDVETNSENPGTNETQSKVKDVELQAFLRLMEDMDANKTGNAIKIQNFLFGDEEAIEGRSLLKIQSLGVESKAGFDFQKYWNNMRQITDFIHIMKEYSDIICPIFKEIGIENLRNVFLQILDLALKPKEDPSE
ncbi:hypothetical protein LSTR_LSTR007131 [Laodelphax striatellus]|uniref:Uncharacterized protein n=1 Tax=Laodelphax striatellus TaxID=195883 RepID=A0A482XIK9_LAOST|nr:hypothetical protein LSTR_LSTR007131 [Laodelphax striatellus]